MARERIVMRPTARGLRGILQLGRYHHTSAQSGLREHMHLRAMEICFLVKGRQTYRVGGHNYMLRGGEVFVTFPDELHSTGGLPQEKGVLYWMVLTVSKNGSLFLGLPEHEGAALLRTLRGIPLRHFHGSWKMKEHLDAFTRLYHEPSNPLRACALANRAVAFLLEVIGCSRNPALRKRTRPLTPVLDHIQNHLDEPLGVPELAKRAGLSPARFKVWFKEETGIPPGEYVQRARIDEACRRLATKEATITRIAFDLGFSSSQYFTTVFKRFTGKSPRQKRMLTAKQPDGNV